MEASLNRYKKKNFQNTNLNGPSEGVRIFIASAKVNLGHLKTRSDKKTLFREPMKVWYNWTVCTIDWFENSWRKMNLPKWNEWQRNMKVTKVQFKSCSLRAILQRQLNEAGVWKVLSCLVTEISMICEILDVRMYSRHSRKRMHGAMNVKFLSLPNVTLTNHLTRQIFFFFLFFVQTRKACRFHKTFPKQAVVRTFPTKDVCQ